MALETVSLPDKLAHPDKWQLHQHPASLDDSQDDLPPDNVAIDLEGTESTQNRLVPRTYPYTASLPYPVESRRDQLSHLSHIVNKLYTAIQAQDLAPGGGSVTATSITHWTRELKSWVRLKFDLPIQTRLALIRVYYDLALATVVSAASNTMIPGGDDVPFDKFVSMFCLLAREHVLLSREGLELDWKPLFNLLKYSFLPAPQFFEPSQQDRSALIRLVQSARLFFDKDCIVQVMEDVLPNVSFLTSFSTNTHPY